MWTLIKWVSKKVLQQSDVSRKIWRVIAKALVYQPGICKLFLANKRECMNDYFFFIINVDAKQYVQKSDIPIYIYR